MGSRPWKSFRLFLPPAEAFDKLSNSNFNCADAGHSVICVGDATGNILVDNNKDELLTYSIPGCSIEQIISAKNSQLILALGVNDVVCTFHLFNSQTLELCGKIEMTSERRPRAKVVASPKLSRFAYKATQNSLALWEIPYNNKSKARFIKEEAEITNYHLVTDETLQKVLYITTVNNVIINLLSGKSRRTVLQNEGVLEGFSTVTNDGCLVVCRDTVVTILGKTGPLTTFEIEGIPRLICWMKSYLIVAYPTPGKESLSIYNVETRSCFGTCEYGDRTKQILCEWNQIILILNDNKIVSLSEADMNSKIEQYIANESFDVALVIAKSQGASEKVVARVHCSIADTLSERHKYSEAIHEYIKTIGYIEPSYVITKYIDTQLAEYLVQYLEKLSDMHLATKQHTTLRFNCYTKLKADTQLDTIVEDCIKNARAGLEPNFDIESAVTVLTMGGYQNHALKIAHAYSFNLLYASLLADESDYNTLFEFLSQVPPHTVADILIEHGFDMLESFPKRKKKDFTHFLAKYCTENEIDMHIISKVYMKEQKYYFSILKRLIERIPNKCSDKVWQDALEIASIRSSPFLSELMDHPHMPLDYDHLHHVFAVLNDRRGLSMLYKKNRMFRQLIDITEPQDLTDICTDFNEEDSSIWLLSLKKILSIPGHPCLDTFLSTSFKYGAISLITVLDHMKGSDSYTFKEIKQYFTEYTNAKHMAKVQSDKDIAESINKLTDCNNSLYSLKHDYFIAKQQRCESCGEALEPPMKHFLCSHSYHVRCLGEDTDNCSTCKKHNREIVKKLFARQEQCDSFSEDGVRIADLSDICKSLNSGAMNESISSLDLIDLANKLEM